MEGKVWRDIYVRLGSSGGQFRTGQNMRRLIMRGKECSNLRTMISPSSAFGMLLSWISLTATVSPVAQFKAPKKTR